jgi:opacity protein-like surface antigen
MSNIHTTIKALICAGLTLIASGMSDCQNLATTTTNISATSPAPLWGKVETSPGFMYIHNSKILGMQQGFNCVGGGGTVAYNFSAAVGFAVDLGGCKILKETAALGPNSPVDGKEFTFLFGPRITFRHPHSPFQPFSELSFGGTRASISCINGDFGNNCGSLSASQLPSAIPPNPTATSFSKTAFTLSVGGGFDIKLNRKFAIRLVQAEYMYTRFGNNCPYAVCSNNNSQNSFRLKSGVVMSWGQGGS